jgi:hypothetical protein
MRKEKTAEVGVVEVVVEAGVVGAEYVVSSEQ